MPIANCIVKRDLKIAVDNIVQLWAQASGVDAKEMTINFTRVDEQFGRQYSVMATLYLPSAWSREQVVSLERGLALALSDGLRQPVDQVHVVTLIVASGHVVEHGEVQRW
ncbi:hypothetical protein LPB19_01820 [Marinobacter salinisoli]|uniref:Uncharacterized protein n=1 Tax=Marinobacter salinisoli TaxID=2769486 RepID=A0ABX7MSL7_9GAMM|nr:hypothetical protein [Marinobacter salinisoli]QSP95183.1 hypothetical protein LPB19_01820 [Marinobacter salinisoli]